MTCISGEDGAMHPRLSVSAVSSWQWTLDDDLRFWSEAGIDHVGLSFRKLEEAGIDAAVARARRRRSARLNIVELGWWDLADRATWPAQQDRLLAAVDAAAALGGCLVLTTGPARALDWDAAADALDDALAPVRSTAIASGVPLTVEHTGPLRLDLSFCTTLRDGSTSPAGSESVCAWRSTAASPSAVSPQPSLMRARCLRTCSSATS